jgi:hypothetical protein
MLSFLEVDHQRQRPQDIRSRGRRTPDVRIVGPENGEEFIQVQQPGLFYGGFVGEDALPVNRPRRSDLLRQVTLKLFVRSPVA